MTYTFYGEPNMLVKRRKRMGFGQIKCIPMFHFDENGEFSCTDDCYPDSVMERLKQKYRYETDETENNPGTEKIYTCKHCGAEFDAPWKLAQHVRKEHPTIKGD